MTTISHSAFELSHVFAGLVHRLGHCLHARVASTPHIDAQSISLNHQETHAVMDFEGGSIECIEGCVWLTHDGDCRDVLLEAGHFHVADRDSRLVIYALASSAIRLVHCPLR